MLNVVVLCPSDLVPGVHAIMYEGSFFQTLFHIRMLSFFGIVLFVIICTGSVLYICVVSVCVCVCACVCVCTSVCVLPVHVCV